MLLKFREEKIARLQLQAADPAAAAAAGLSPLSRSLTMTPKGSLGVGGVGGVASLSNLSGATRRTSNGGCSDVSTPRDAGLASTSSGLSGLAAKLQRAASGPRALGGAGGSDAFADGASIFLVFFPAQILLVISRPWFWTLVFSSSLVKSCKKENGLHYPLYISSIDLDQLREELTFMRLSSENGPHGLTAQSAKLVFENEQLKLKV